MKKIFIFCIVALFASVSFGQTVEESQVPDVVIKALKAKFINVKVTKWEKEDTIYSAEFLMNEAATEAEFNEKGIWVCTEWDVPVEYSPKAINDYISENYAGYKLKEVSITELPIDGKIYIAEICKKKTSSKLYFSLKGEFQKAITEICDKKKEKKCMMHNK